MRGGGAKQYTYLLGILILAIFLRWYYFFGIDFDGAQYTLHAKSIAEGVYDPTYLNGWNQGIRFGMILPIVLMYKLFGVSDFSTFFFQFFVSIVQIVFIYYLGKYLFNEKVGLLAAFLLAIYPLDVNNASILEADILISFLTAVTIFLFYKGFKEQKNLLLVLSGVLLGIAFFTKIFSGLLFFGYVLYSLIYVKEYKKIIKNTLFILVGLLVIFIPTVLYFTVTVHDPFYFYTVEKEANDYLLTENLIDPTYYPKYMLLIQPYNDPPMFGIYFIILFFAIIYVIVKRSERTNLLLFWLLPALLVLMFIPTLPKVQRYLLFIEVPMILLIAYFSITFYDLITKKIYRIAFVGTFFILLLITSIPAYGGYDLIKGGLSFNGQLMEINQREELYYLKLKDLPRKDIYVTHYDNVPFLSYYFDYTYNGTVPFGYRGKADHSIYDIHFVNPEEIDNAYVILDIERMNSEQDILHYYDQGGASLDQWRGKEPLNTWNLLLKHSNSEGRVLFVIFDVE